MTFFTAALLLALQEPTLAENSRKVFSSLIDVVVENDRLTIRSTASKEDVDNLTEDLSSRLKVARGSCETSGCSSSWSGGSGKDESSATIVFEPERGRFAWSYVTSLARESIDFRQTQAGAVRLVFQHGDSTTVFNQDRDGRCTLLVDTGKEASRWNSDSFTALMASQGEAVGKHVLAPLERYFDDAPLGPFSASVIELVLGAAPLSAVEVAALRRMVVRLGEEDIAEREMAVVELGRRSAKNPTMRFALGRELDSATEAEIKSRLGGVLTMAPRGKESYRLVADQALYRDLDYLLKLLEAGHPAKPRLEALTGRRFTTPEEWKTWMGRNRAKLKWNSEKWLYEP